MSGVNNFSREKYLEELSKMTLSQFCIEWDRVVNSLRLTPQGENKIFEEDYVKNNTSSERRFHGKE